MAFCIKCGQALADGATYCPNCKTEILDKGNSYDVNINIKAVLKGKPEEYTTINIWLEHLQKTFSINIPNSVKINQMLRMSGQGLLKPDGKRGDVYICFTDIVFENIDSNTTEFSTRKTVYDGEIHKCPNCGEVLNAFVSLCPTCNYELRGSQATASLQQFYLDLYRVKNSDEKTFLIRNYPIPNSKEDILEFMILASSNIRGEADKNIFEAWVSKFEQVYQKAQITLQDDPTFVQIEDIYKKTEKNIYKEKILHTTNSIGNLTKTYFKIMPNPIFAVVLALLLIFNIVRLFSGNFAPIDIIFDAIVLTATYRITNKKNKK